MCSYLRIWWATICESPLVSHIWSNQFLISNLQQRYNYWGLICASWTSHLGPFSASQCPSCVTLATGSRAQDPGCPICMVRNPACTRTLTNQVNFLAAIRILSFSLILAHSQPLNDFSVFHWPYTERDLGLRRPELYGPMPQTTQQDNYLFFYK